MPPRLSTVAFALALPLRAAPAARAGVASAGPRRRGLAACAQPPPPSTAADCGFRIVKERPLFGRYQSVTERVVAYPCGQEVSYDVVGHASGRSVFVFPLSAARDTVTLLREYAPGPHRVMWGFPAGFVEDGKHASLEAAVRAELSEEARLTCGGLLPLTGNGGIMADKYSKNQFHFFLAVDCESDPQPGPRDVGEWIEIVPDVPVDEVREIVRSGQMNTPHSLLATLALSYLDRR